MQDPHASISNRRARTPGNLELVRPHMATLQINSLHSRN